jgi:pyruvate/2-oxoglutarate dehydrogenase complex dihydrolipoamide dehydrogenase (E3) component
MPDRYDLVIVGMGSGGMVAAEFAASLGLRVAVAERGRVGGDCLWTGCVPSKALLASAKAAHTMRTADELGLEAAEPAIDRARVWKRVRSVQHDIAGSDDDPSRFEAMGVEIVAGSARLLAPDRVQVDGRTLATRFVLLCCGSRPTVPPIPGLADAAFTTSETLFELDEPPASIMTIGGGPIAVEMAQACSRLGIPATLLQKGPRILPRDEPDLVDRLVDVLRVEGVDTRTDVVTERVTLENGTKVVHGTDHGHPATWAADEILVAAGRTPNVDGLGIDALGIETGPDGVVVDQRGRSTIDTVYAAGDVAGRHRFTHAAAYEAVRAVRDMFFPGKGTVTALVPWCTFTDPELAHAGPTVAEARARYGDRVEVWHEDLSHNDRARADGAATGAVVIITHKRRVIGAQILAPAAGEMINELALAIAGGMKLDALAGFTHVYPTVSTSIARIAGDAAFDRARRLRWLMRRTSTRRRSRA